MNEQDVIRELKSLSKPYLYVPNVSQSTFSDTLRKYQAGLLKQQTIEAFFKKFCFEKENSVFIQTVVICKERKVANGK